MWNHRTRKGDICRSRDEQILLSVLGLRRGEKVSLPSFRTCSIILGCELLFLTVSLD